jgi:sugar-phosphatase
MASSTSAPPVQIRCKGILFDMDGILISSLGSVERSWTKWAEMRGVDPSAALAIVHGCRSIDSVRRLRPDLDAEAENTIIEDMEVEDTEGVRVLSGVPELLRALPAPFWTVVTSATERLARVRMASAGIPVPERFISAEQVANGKPQPDPYLAGAALLGFDPADCVVFEDAASGAEAGRAAGCTVVATTFSHSVESLEAADYLIEDVAGVRVEILDGNQGLVLTLPQLTS